MFVDEMGTHTSLAPLYAYAPEGERVFFEIPRNRGKNTTLLPYEPSSRRDGAIDGRGRGDHRARVFETYVEKVLVPSLEPGQIVVMDNLGAHRPKRIRQLIEERAANSCSCRPTPRTSIR